MANNFAGQPSNVGSYKNITSTTAGTLINAGTGVLYSITLNKPVATAVITIYDGLTTGGTVIGTITIPTSPMPVTLYYDVEYVVGLYIVVATASCDLTLNYK